MFQQWSARTLRIQPSQIPNYSSEAKAGATGIERTAEGA